jgi:hypothetical protein
MSLKLVFIGALFDRVGAALRFFSISIRRCACSLMDKAILALRVGIGRFEEGLSSLDWVLFITDVDVAAAENGGRDELIELLASGGMALTPDFGLIFDPEPAAVLDGFRSALTVFERSRFDGWVAFVTVEIVSLRFIGVLVVRLVSDLV